VTIHVGMDFATLAKQALRFVVPGERRLLGITGAPGAGKSTLAEYLVTALGDRCRLVPMDGFHLAQVELRRLGRAHRKGAPDTFDAEGYAALLRRLRSREDDVVYAPAFDRGLEEPIAGALPIPREVPLVITEGNYLLVDEAPWAGVGPLLDVVWYLEVDERVRLERLVVRHVTFGKDPDEARLWAEGSDQRNAEVIAATRGRADDVIRVCDEVVRLPGDE
jgi:pantothenate kinase